MGEVVELKRDEKRQGCATGRRGLQEEVVELRAKVAEQARCIQDLTKQCEKAEAKAEHWRKRYFSLERQTTKEIQKLQLRLGETESLLEQVKATLAWHQKHTFGQRTETSDHESSEAEPEEPAKQKRAKGKKPGAAGFGRKERQGLFEEENEIEVPESKRVCRCCSKPYRQLGKGDRSTMLEIVQELYKIVDLGKCYVKDCDCDEGSDRPRLVRSEPPPRVFPRAIFGPNLWTDILIEKYYFQKPLQRAAQKYLLMGASVPVSTISSGLKKIDGLISGLAEKIKDHAKGAQQWNMDETTWRVFGDSDKQRWWLWAVVTPDCCAYMLDESRSSAVPQAFFKGVNEGILVTDRYSAYKAVKCGIRKAYCWAHVRRDFIKIRDGYPKLKGWGEEWLQLIDKLFAENAKRTQMILSDAVIADEELHRLNYNVKFLADTIADKAAKELKSKPTEAQRKALTSLRKHWEGLTIFVNEPLVPMDNNAAERALRNPVVGRKNYYGSGSAWSGHFAAKMFTIFQTWLFNRLDPNKLLQDFLTRCAQSRGQPPPSEDFLPSSMSADRLRQFQLPNSR